MNDVTQQLWFLWLTYWVSGAVVGSFVGTLLAFGIRALWHKLTKRSEP
jgi:hypothetical protein